VHFDAQKRCIGACTTNEERAMKNMSMIFTTLVLSLASAAAIAQAPAAPRPAAPPPAPVAPMTPPVAPPPNATAPIANPPVQGGQPGTIPSVDANGNAVPSSNPAQGANTGTGAAGYPQATASGGARIMPFAMLDVDKAGAIKMDQARGDPWLAQHFVQCDDNHNEEVTQSEYEKCTSR
jgi:hypothetical protein